MKNISRLNFTRRQSLLRGFGFAAVPLTGLVGCRSTASATSAAGLAPTALTLPQWRMDERWTYQVVNGFNSTVVAKPQYRIAKLGEVIEVAVEQQTVERYNSRLQLLAEDTFGETTQYNSPVDWLIVDGKTSAQHSSTRYANNSTPEHLWQQTVTLQSPETISVPAGTFSCAVIQRTVYFVHPDRFRSHSQRVDRIWYAPEVKRWVQREVRGSYVDAGDADVKRSGGRRQEDWRIWQLLSHTSAPISG